MTKNLTMRKILNSTSSVILRTICLFLFPPHFANSKAPSNSGNGDSNSSGSSSGGSTTAIPPSRSTTDSSSSWVFWYYAADGSRECGNICKIVFSFMGIIALGIIIVGILRCVIIYNDAKIRKQRQGGENQDLERASTTESLPQVNGHLANQPNKLPNKAPSTGGGGILPISSAGSKPYQFEYQAKDYETPPVKFEQSMVSFDPPFTQSNVTVQTDLPLHSSWSTKSQETGKKVILRYFEVTVWTNAEPTRNLLAVGLATKPCPKDSIVGFTRDSIGYHSIKGYLHDHSQGGEPYGPPFGAVGDVIGCGYYPEAGTVFFTKNGEWIGMGAKELKENDWYPTISANGPLKVVVNFGDQPGSDFQFRPSGTGWIKETQ